MTTANTSAPKDQVVVRVPHQVKMRAEAACKAMGMPMSSAIMGFLRYVGEEQRIPFEFAVPQDEFYSSAHMAELERRAADMEAGLNVHSHDLIEK
ncbi:type II toxin-antitoxin system RelB/DinJ family antitoxin [Aeriscardovia aeriphila]|uniref:Addiction module antitoxin n=1 Tax=Aeriscardovia aeriphila TaxID=218139 RepID=A0A261FCB8_9BIFI|nr:type II toxin-antitoxin system RelB/DinJ family antitoxin [Aeriscardovia aeriphila]NYI26256.1 addiction module RelB/DinJ family antitoxin [Aeriscardovia aeriphila]OZG56801.1 addiction module antitoxin [Aeriscardovia aeriphila]